MAKQKSKQGMATSFPGALSSSRGCNVTAVSMSFTSDAICHRFAKLGLWSSFRGVLAQHKSVWGI